MLAGRETQKQATDSSVVGKLRTHRIHRIHLYHIGGPTVKEDPPQRQALLETIEVYAE